MAIRASKLKVGLRQVWRVTVLENLWPITDKLLPFLSSGFPLVTGLIDACQTSMGKGLRVLLGRDYK